MTADEATDQRAALRAARVETLATVAALSRDLDAVMRASTDANADDEHDPEGSTVAFERAQIAALLDSARREVGEIDSALTRVDSGSYGICEACGAAIATERLRERVAARRCVACAAGRRRGSDGPTR